MDQMMKLREDGTLECPRCGYHGQHAPGLGSDEPFRYVEAILAYRAIRFSKVIREGYGGVPTLNVNGTYETGEGYDDGEAGTARIECRDCGESSSLPQIDDMDVDVDWHEANDALAPYEIEELKKHGQRNRLPRHEEEG